MLLVEILVGGIVGLSAPVAAVESPPTGTLPGDFATQDGGCLGPLRSQTAQRNFAGVEPLRRALHGDVNPGAHQGTVGEEEFLTTVIGVEDVAAFCTQLA